MELMLLVYAVENLSYNGSFFGTMFNWVFFISIVLLVLQIGLSLYNQHLGGSYQKVISTSLDEKDKLRIGSEFVLDKSIGGLVSGKKYQVRHIWRSLNEFRVEGSSEELNLKGIEDQLKKQEHKEVTVEPKILKFKAPFKTLITLGLLFITLDTLLPQRQTAIYMVGAYAAQEVLTADKTKELGNKTYLAVSNQLDKWAEEVPELKTLISDQVEKVVKDKIVEEVK